MLHTQTLAHLNCWLTNQFDDPEVQDHTRSRILTFLEGQDAEDRALWLDRGWWHIFDAAFDCAADDTPIPGRAA